MPDDQQDLMKIVKLGEDVLLIASLGEGDENFNKKYTVIIQEAPEGGTDLRADPTAACGNYCNVYGHN